ncbi:MAG TPA: hypothetical protein VGM37_21830 [Armatimonadota bacterium]
MANLISYVVAGAFAVLVWRVIGYAVRIGAHSREALDRGTPMSSVARAVALYLGLTAGFAAKEALAHGLHWEMIVDTLRAHVVGAFAISVLAGIADWMIFRRKASDGSRA